MAVEQVGKDAFTGADTVWCVWREKGDYLRETFPPTVLSILLHRFAGRIIYLARSYAQIGGTDAHC
jgi:hypothetical protein